MTTAPELIAEYLSQPNQAERRAAVTSASPLTRAVLVRTAAWRPWLAGQRQIKGVPLKLPRRASELAVSALDDPRLLTEHGVDPRNERRVRRSDLASGFADDSSPDAVVRAWTWVMLWGSGITNGRGPMNTAKGLSDPTLARRLVRSRELVIDRQTRDAYREMVSLRGSGPAFFTKWLWACGLATEFPDRPLILDTRVAVTLRKLGFKARVSSDSQFYSQQYVPTMVEWADAIRGRIGGAVDAEKVEYLLFDRHDGHLLGWLSQEG